MPLRGFVPSDGDEKDENHQRKRKRIGIDSDSNKSNIEVDPQGKTYSDLYASKFFECSSQQTALTVTVAAESLNQHTPSAYRRISRTVSTTNSQILNSSRTSPDTIHQFELDLKTQGNFDTVSGFESERDREQSPFKLVDKSFFDFRKLSNIDECSVEVLRNSIATSRNNPETISVLHIPCVAAIRSRNSAVEDEREIDEEGYYGLADDELDSQDTIYDYQAVNFPEKPMK